MTVEPGRCGQEERKPPDPRSPLRVTSRELMQDRTELVIVHDGREYRLRVTQNGKLILTA
jgi:hemin uptake protein HemP